MLARAGAVRETGVVGALGGLKIGESHTKETIDHDQARVAVRNDVCHA